MKRKELNKEDFDEISQVLNEIRHEKPLEVVSVKLPISLKIFLRKRGKASAYIRKAVLEKLERELEADDQPL